MTLPASASAECGHLFGWDGSLQSYEFSVWCFGYQEILTATVPASEGYMVAFATHERSTSACQELAVLTGESKSEGTAEDERCLAPSYISKPHPGGVLKASPFW